MCLWLFMIALILLDFTLCISVSLCGDMWLHNYSYCTLCLRFHFRWIVWWCLLQWFLSPIFSFPALKSELSTRSKLMLPVFPTEAPIPPAIAISILKSWDLMYWPVTNPLETLEDLLQWKPKLGCSAKGASRPVSFGCCSLSSSCSRISGRLTINFQISSNFCTTPDSHSIAAVWMCFDYI